MFICFIGETTTEQNETLKLRLFLAYDNLISFLHLFFIWQRVGVIYQVVLRRLPVVSGIWFKFGLGGWIHRKTGRIFTFYEANAGLISSTLNGTWAHQEWFLSTAAYNSETKNKQTDKIKIGLTVCKAKTYLLFLFLSGPWYRFSWEKNIICFKIWRDQGPGR